MMFFYLIKTKIKHFISNQSNIWYEITARRTNRKVLWCSGYHVCLTRRRCLVQAWTASRQVFDKMMFFYLIKTKIKHFISNQSIIWYEITARRTNRKVQWCSGYHVCLTHRRFQVQAWTAARKVFDKMIFFYLIKTKIKHFISNQSNIWYEITARRSNRKVLWCSGYHVCCTCRGSPVQAWTASRQVFDKMMFFYLTKTKIKHFISNQFNIWYEITARRTNRKVLWCSGYHVCITCRRSPVPAWTASRQVFDKMMFFYLIKTKIKHFISNQSNIWYEITARRTNRKVLWCSGYHVCLTRRRCLVQAWTASRQVFDKMMFFYLIKTKIKHFISNQSIIWYEITARRTNRKVQWCSGYHVCLTHRRFQVQAWTAARKVFDKMIFFYLIKTKIKHFISNQSNIWYEITARRSNRKVLWCSGYHVCCTCRGSPVQAWTASRQVFDKMMFFYLTKTKIKHFISNQFNIWYEITARRTNRKVLWCSGYHVCITCRRSPVPAWTASRRVFDKMMFFLPD